jgi:transposase
MERGSGGASAQGCPGRGADEVGCGVGQRGRGGGLAQTVAPQGYLVLPRRWVVERTIAWIDQQRRMSKDYERLCASGEALVYAAMIRLMTRRLAGA